MFKILGFHIHPALIYDQNFSYYALISWKVLLGDVHPPGYYFLAYLFNPIILNVLCLMYTNVYLNSLKVPKKILFLLPFSYVILTYLLIARMYLLNLLIWVMFYWLIKNKKYRQMVILCGIAGFFHYYLLVLWPISFIIWWKNKSLSAAIKSHLILIPMAFIIAYFIYFYQWYESKIAYFSWSFPIFIGLGEIEIISGVHLEDLYYWFGNTSFITLIFGIFGLFVLFFIYFKIYKILEFEEKIIYWIPWLFFIFANMLGLFHIYNFTARYFIQYTVLIPFFLYRAKKKILLFLYFGLNILFVILNYAGLFSY